MYTQCCLHASTHPPPPTNAHSHTRSRRRCTPLSVTAASAQQQQQLLPVFQTLTPPIPDLSSAPRSTMPPPLLHANPSFDHSSNTPAISNQQQQQGSHRTEIHYTLPPQASLVDALSQPLPSSVYALELSVAAVGALAIWMWQGRPVGWVQQGILEVKPSETAGLGLYASYPGRVRSGAEMAAKIQGAPAAAGYAFSTGDGRYLDPTDASGTPSPYPNPGPPWPLPIEVLLPYANEPPKGGLGTNCFVETGSAGATELIFQANRDIEPGEEIFIDYGLVYDRSGYGR